jgi:hypothetical protein
VFLKVKDKISSLRLGNCPKLEAIYCGPFEILEKIGPVAYIIAFSTSMRVHNVFHVSLLKKYVSGPNHIIDWTVNQVEHEGDFWMELVRILDWKVKMLRNKSMGMVKFEWTCYVGRILKIIHGNMKKTRGKNTCKFSKGDYPLSINSTHIPEFYFSNKK